jgi:LysW-gamma-L-lysine carboxypeptidase
MDENYPVELLLNLLKIYSPSGKEKEISNFLFLELRKLGFNTEIDEVGNVKAVIGKGRPRIFLCGHMDTVKGMINPHIRGKVIFGRGAVDAKSSLAALICGAKKFKEICDKGEITLLAVVDEEGYGKGIRHFLSKCNEKYDYAIFGEPSGTYGLTVGYRGRILLKISCKASKAHSSIPQFFDNAIYKAKNIIDELLKIEEKWENIKGEFFWKPSLCVTKIKGGNSHNVIPSKCDMVVDIRIPPNMMKEVEEEVMKIIKKNENVYVKKLSENPPFLENENSILVKLFLESIKEISGREGRLIKKTGTSDVNDFAEKMKIPCVVYGPGNSKLSHTEKENVSIIEYLESIEIIKNTLKKIIDYENKRSIQ